MRTIVGNDVGAFLFGEARRKLLGRLYGHPDERYFLRQLAREVDVAPGAAQRELTGLVGAGLITRVAEGRQVYFQANRASPIFPELESLILKTVGAVPLLRNALASLGPAVTLAFIFGSAAKGLLRNESDIDVLVVGDATFPDVVEVMSDPQRILAREVNPVVFSEEELRRKVAKREHFVATVLDEQKVFLIGDEDGVGRVAQKRVAPRAQDERRRNRGSVRGRRPRSRR